MFRNVEMCELSLLARRQDIEAVTRVIAQQGVLHQVDTSYLSREEDWEAEPWHERIQEYRGLEQRISLIMSTLGVPALDAEGVQELDLSEDMRQVRASLIDIEREVMPLVNEYKAHEQRLMELRALRHRLEPLIPLDVDLASLRDLSFLHAQIGVVPAANLDRFNASLMHVPHVILPLGEAGEGQLVALFGAAKDREILERAAHSAYLSPITIPEGYRGTPRSIIRTIEAEIENLLVQQGALEADMQGMREKWSLALQGLMGRVHVDLALLRAMDRYGQVRDVYLVAGWVPKSKANEVIAAVQRVTRGRVAVDMADADHSGSSAQVPSTLRNPHVLAAFQELVTNYSFPAYDEIDPTPLLAITFMLMFGIMFGDVGHGLVLVLAGLASIKRWVPALAKLGSLGPVLMGSGAMAMVFGFLYGSIFGVEDFLPAVWLRPLDDIMSILIATVALGVVLLMSGFVVNMANGVREQDWQRVFFSRYGLAGMWFYLGLLVLLGSVVMSWNLPTIVILALTLLPMVLILFGEPLGNLMSKRRPLIHESWGLYLITSFFELFEALISYLSNSLSYVRLGAFAVAHGGLSSVFFILAEMGGGPRSVLYWLFVIGGNIFIIGFEGLIVGIQTLRLEYYEFFSKFYKGGGLPYRPLSLSEDKS